MNYNILAYFIYLTLMIFIIVFVGRFFYRNGRVFIVNLFKNRISLADTINYLLLIAYYLFNIGYALFTLSIWEPVVTIQLLISSISANMGILILILAITHYLNMVVIYFLSSRKSKLFTNKNF